MTDMFEEPILERFYRRFEQMHSKLTLEADSSESLIRWWWCLRRYDGGLLGIGSTPDLAVSMALDSAAAAIAYKGAEIVE